MFHVKHYVVYVNILIEYVSRGTSYPVIFLIYMMIPYLKSYKDKKIIIMLFTTLIAIYSL